MMVERHAEARPAVVRHHVETVGSALQRTDAALCETEVLEDAAQLGAQPHRASLAVHLLEDKQPARLLGVEAGRLDHPHHRVLVPVAVHVARLKLVDGVGQPPVVEPVEAVVLFLQRERLCPAFAGQQPERQQKDGYRFTHAHPLSLPISLANIGIFSDICISFPKKLKKMRFSALSALCPTHPVDMGQ